MESGLIPKSGYNFKSISIRGFDRDFSLNAIYKNIANLASIASCISLFQSLWILKEFKPDVILGAGGYPCGPVILAGYFMGIPAVIMEQNAVPGFTNRILANIVKGAALGFDIPCKAFEKIKNCKVTGTPIRKEIIVADRGEGIEFFGLDPSKKTILVFGGSLGSMNINLNFVKAVKKIEETLPDWAASFQILHSTGKRDYPVVLEEKSKLKSSYKVFEYIDKINHAYSVSDLVIQRAGGVSIAEVCCRGLPSIVIPWKGAANDHQAKNAGFLAKNDAAMIIPDDKLKPDVLSHKIIELLQNYDKLKALAENSKKLGKPDASAKIVALLENVIEG